MVLVWQPPPDSTLLRPGQPLQGQQPLPSPGTQIGPAPPLPPPQPMQQYGSGPMYGPPPSQQQGPLGAMLGLMAGSTAVNQYGQPNMGNVSNPNLVDSSGHPIQAKYHMDKGDLWRWAAPYLILVAILAYVAGYFKLLPWIGNVTGWW